MRDKALALYKAPFRFQHGYIFDADGQMVADDGDMGDSVARVRGWGHIGYLPDAKQLQDEVGAIIADALTAYWTPSPQALTKITAADITPEMHQEWNKIFRVDDMSIPKDGEIMAAAYNAVIKAEGK